MANSELQNGMLLKHSEYRIERTLGWGGFGITYKAEQISLGRKVAIKEFFMKELCERDEGTSHVTLSSAGSREIVTRYREKFLKEACNIAKLNHPNIVRIIDVFEENGTAYYVMEYAENGSLADKVRREGCLPESVATRYILQVAEALDYVHQRKMNHLDVKPANIMLNEKDECVLIDFGLSKQYDAMTGNQTSTTPVGISEGYAPIEQYMQKGLATFSPETDIYSLGATFYMLLTGIAPPNASYVNNEGLPISILRKQKVSNRSIILIQRSMKSSKKERIQKVRIFIDELKVALASEKLQKNEHKIVENSSFTDDKDTTHLEFPIPNTDDNKQRLKKSNKRIKSQVSTKDKNKCSIGKKQDANKHSTINDIVLTIVFMSCFIPSLFHSIFLPNIDYGNFIAIPFMIVLVECVILYCIEANKKKMLYGSLFLVINILSFYYINNNNINLCGDKFLR